MDYKKKYLKYKLKYLQLKGGGLETEEEYQRQRNEQLILYAAQNNVAKVSELIEAGVDLEFKNNNKTALEIAYLGGFEELAKFLIFKGANTEPLVGYVNHDDFSNDLYDWDPKAMPA